MNRVINTVIDTSNADHFRSGTEYIIDAATLFQMLGQNNLVVVDVREQIQCPDGHIPGAWRIDYSRLVRTIGYAEGMLPRKQDIAKLLSECGITRDSFVVAYDDNYGVDAARLLWTLDTIGHTKYALLSGGFAEWDEQGFPISCQSAEPLATAKLEIQFGNASVDKNTILARLPDENIKILDNRSIAEFNGSDKRAQRSGRIPGAITLRMVERH